MRYVLIVHLFELVDVTIFFLKTGSKLEKFDLGQVKSIIWTEGVCYDRRHIYQAEAH